MRTWLSFWKQKGESRQGRISTPTHICYLEFRCDRPIHESMLDWELAATCWTSPSVAVFWHEVSVVRGARGTIGGNGVGDGDSLVDAGPEQSVDAQGTWGTSL